MLDQEEHAGPGGSQLDPGGCSCDQEEQAGPGGSSWTRRELAGLGEEQLNQEAAAGPEEQLDQEEAR
uniref:Uncharacterized protein n=1 Tax=Parascaris univalens TaxID=6257 RepID=A0A915CKT8_PARUN